MKHLIGENWHSLEIKKIISYGVIFVVEIKQYIESKL